MISFLRRIRKKLANENKFLQYFSYALGEVVLVVIGILIALQINNWNEEKKLNKTEHILLKQILKSLKSDFGRTKFIYENRALKKRSAIDDLLNNLNQEELPHDSILRPSFLNMTITLSFNYDKGAYESLKSHGLDIIRNDSLRQRIIRLYENDLPLGIEFINNRRELEYQLRENYLLELTEYDYVQAQNGQWEGDINIDFRKIKDSQTLKNLIRLENEVASNYLRRLEDKVSDFENVILLIQNELSK